MGKAFFNKTQIKVKLNQISVVHLNAMQRACTTSKAALTSAEVAHECMQVLYFVILELYLRRQLI